MAKKWHIQAMIAIVILLTLVVVLVAWFYYPAISPTKTTAKSKIEGGALPPGCSCHSKNPRLVSMHNLFGIKDCRKCHGKSENLTGRKSKKMTAARKAALEQRMRKEAICQQCHKQGKVITTRKTAISGRLFCPKDQKMHKKNEALKRNGKYFCPKHGIELVDIDEIAVKSTKEPKNEYCIACHPITTSLQNKHRKVAEATRDSSLKNCLICHTSHSKCSGCHF